ncbi:subtilisin-like protein [Auricularia subglabra TFB-10046 SS5]|nr:subtilisin-like protein [Auricularia subglabra TFB-10046 SS5]
MKAIAVACALAGLSFAVLGASYKIERKPNFPNYVEGKVIVELTSASVGKREDIHARFFDDLDKRLPPSTWSARKTFDSDVFVGAALALTNPDDIAKLGAIKGVKAVRPVPRVSSPKITLGTMPDKAKYSTPSELFPPNIMTGVNKIHATGNKGKGIKVGIIDSGVDYTHPALGGGFGPGFKVIGGYDFVGDDYPNGDPVPDNDPLSQCNGHGTHVAGIVAADPDNEWNMTGVAPEASINAYRIFGCDDGSDDSIVVDALLRAYEDGNDVITLSLGGDGGWAQGTSSVVASRIADRGRVVTVAAGNSGDSGAWFTSNPGDGLSVISVSSTNSIASGPHRAARISIPHDPIVRPHVSMVEHQLMDTQLYIFDITLNALPIAGEWPMYTISHDATVEEDACKPLADSTPDLSKYVVLVRRGGCDFSVKIANVGAKGGKNFLFYNANGREFGPIVTGSDTAALIQEVDGLFLLDNINAGTAFTISFPPTGLHGYIPNTEDGGLISSFTSYGPSFDMHFKPAIAAPGGEIISTWPVPMGAFAVSSGTSMATPHAAGVAALILKGRGIGVAKGIRDLLETTSTSVPQSLDEGAPPQTLAQAGAGQISVFNALTYTTEVTPGELLLNDTAHWKGTHTIWITNNGQEPRIYTLKHVPAGTAVTLQQDSIQPNYGPVPQDNSIQAQVQLAFQSVTVPSSGKVSVQVSIEPPEGVDAQTLPVISGQILVSTAGETLRVSYLGVAAPLKSTQVIDNTDEILGMSLPALLDGAGAIQESTTDYTFVGEDHPVLAWRLVFGSPSVKLDLVAADIAHQTNLGKRGTMINSWWWPGAFTPNNGSSAAVPTLGALFQFDWMPRNDFFDTPSLQTSIRNVFANGTTIPYGRYRVLLRALKVNGDRTKEEDSEVWLSPIIGVIPAE